MNILEVQKYGGSSMANAAAMRQSASVAAQSRESGKSILVVTSAMSGVTDQLTNTILNAVAKTVSEWSDQRGVLNDINKPREGETALDRAVREGLYEEVLRANEERHQLLINENVDPKLATSLRLRELVAERTIEAKAHIASMVDLQSVDKRWLDWIRGMLGEGFTAPITAAHLQSSGVDAAYRKAYEVMVTDGTFGNANPHIESIKARCRDTGMISSLVGGRIEVTEGFIGSPDGGRRITNFDKGGSDRSATVFGEALADIFDHIAVILYKADPKLAGVMSADPNIVEDAHVIDRMNHLEASNLTLLGGDVIHPKAVSHALRSAHLPGSRPFPIYVKSTEKPELPGTLINDELRPEDSPIKAVSVIKNGISIGIMGMGMDKPGIIGKVTGAFPQEGIDIIFLSQPSPLEVYLAYRYSGREKGSDLEDKLKKECERTREIIKKALEYDIGTKDVASVSTNPASLIGVIGMGAQTLFNSGRVFDRLNGGTLDKVKSSYAYRMASGTYAVSMLFDFRDEELINALVRSVHGSVFTDKN